MEVQFDIFSSINKEARGQLHALAASPLLKNPRSGGQETVWAPELAWTWWRRQKSLPLPANERDS